MSSPSKYVQLVGQVMSCDIDYKSQTVPGLRRLLTLFMQVHFADPVNYGFYAEEIGCLHYNLEDPDSSTLVVRPSHVHAPDEGDKQNGVFIEVAQVSSRKLALDDYEGMSDDESLDAFVRMREVMVHIHCQAGSSDIAAALAETAHDFLMAVRDTLSSRLGLHKMDLKGIRPQRRQGNDPVKGLSVWTVGLELTFPSRIFSAVESHRIKTISTEIRSYAASA